ncbi:hypothetical protein QQX98_003131 [Neonectria punicea]|uniref:NACHT-NTPase and P-loop NTPases N-terminal domain-containing protein n=1 Tax=Neonectria punicea TaxID=979145 RepID=A0ABR1HFG8_9HYPO
MAEILDIVSSVIAIVEAAGKLGTSALTLKRLWDEVQDVPASIEQRITQLQLLAPVLQDMEGEFMRTRDIVQHNPAGMLSLNYCQKATQELEEMAAAISLTTAIFIAAVIFDCTSIIVSEFRTLREQERMEEASRNQHTKESSNMLKTGKGHADIEDVSLSKSASGKRWKYLDSSPTPRSTRWQDSILPQLFTYQTTEVAKKPGSIEATDRFRVHQARFQLPSWLSQKAWDIQAHKAYDGWRFQLKPWSTRSMDSAIFQCVQAGRADLILQVFRTNEASIYDRTPWGATLLECAIAFSQPDLVRLFSRMGLQVSDVDILKILKYVAETLNRLRVLELFAIWIDEDGFSHLLDDSDTTENTGAGTILGGQIWWTPGLLESVVEPNIPLIDQLVSVSAFDKIVWTFVRPKVLMEIVQWNRFVLASAFPAQLGPGNSSLYGFLSQYLQYNGVLSVSMEIEDWGALARWMLANASPKDVAQPNDDLEAAAVDVEEYIRWELATCKGNIGLGMGLKRGFQRTRFHQSGPSLVLLKRGTRAKDWEFDWDPCVEQFVGEFWRVVDAPPNVKPALMPGTRESDSEDDSKGIDTRIAFRYFDIIRLDGTVVDLE